MKRLEDIAGRECNKMLWWADGRVKVCKLSEVSETESAPIFKVFTLKIGMHSVPET